MPSRRWSRRNARPMRKGSSRSQKGFEQKNRLKTSHKPRLIRRYMPRKLLDSNTLKLLSHPTPTHPAKPNLRASPQDKYKGAALKASGHNAVVDGRMTTTRQAAVALTAVPNPTPDTGATLATSPVGAGAPLLGALTLSDTETSGLSVIPPATITSVVSKPRTAVVSFSALPPLQSFAVSTTPGSIGPRPIYPIETRPAASPTASSSPGDDQSHEVSVALIILLSVGGGLLMLGFCIVVKMCTRPTRRVRPTPSLPISKDLEADEDYYETKESPIFGGEERMSSALAANGPGWNWITYPHVKSTAQVQIPAQRTCLSLQQNGVHYEPPAQSDMRFNLATQPPPSVPSVLSSQSSEILAGRPILQNMPAIATTSHRLSRGSLSMYAPTNVGQPMSNARQETAYTADGHDVIKRSKSKTNHRRMSQSAHDERKHRNSTTSFIGLAYDGDDIGSPAPVDYGHVIPDTPIQNSEFEGRARVKSGYFAAGTYPRISALPSASYSIATATRINVANRNSFVNNKLLSHHKSNSKRMRDTQALTYALGLASPRTDYGVASPQPTLYPDDSMSVIDARRQKKKNTADRRPVEAIPDVPVIVPMDKESGSTDTLMGMSFGVSQMSLTGLDLGPVSESEESSDRQTGPPIGSSSSRNMTTDRAPRVPSPPALPSLAQMGLARNNPEAYDNYRSPTYSLYGLYQSADRKSFVARS